MSKQRVGAAVVAFLATLSTTSSAKAPATATSTKPATSTSTTAVAVDADMRTVRDRLVSSQLVTDPKSLAALVDEARGYAETLHPDGTWPDLTYRDTGPGVWGPSKHMDRVLAMAKAYRSSTSPLVNDAPLRDKIHSALDYELVNDFRQSNWWFQEIGIPTQVGNVMLLMSGETSPDQLARAIKILERSKLKNYTGANLAWIARCQVMRGCLENEPTIVGEAFDAMWKEVEVVPPGREGIQADFSFHQHGPLIYSGGYGASFMVDATQFVCVAADTRFAIPGDRLAILSEYIVEGQQWFLTPTTWDFGVGGREITRDYKGGGTNSARAMAALLAKLPGPRQADLQLVADRLGPRTPPLVGNRHFWRSDMMTHHRADYYVSTRMFSTRTLNTDGHKGGTINNEGRRSHHLADGAMCIVQRGDEYKKIFPIWDWNRIPGTTAQQAELDPKLVWQKGQSDFVGGASDGTYGAAAMDLSRDGLHARKAWFYFDREIVCLGAGISCESDKSVLTSINQTMLHGEVRTSASAAALPAGDRVVNDATWVWHDNVGYFFQRPTPVHVTNRPQSGRWSDIGTGSDELVTSDVFSIWIDHGVKPADASYEYVILPGVKATETDRLSKGVLKTLANSESVQAVYHDELKQLQVVFWKAGSIEACPGGRLEVDQPCILLARETADGVVITVANPKNEAIVVNVTRDGRSARFELPSGPRAGLSVTKTLAR